MHDMYDPNTCMIKLILVGQFFYTDNILKTILFSGQRYEKKLKENLIVQSE